jgi:NitT/TauT family transport system permease protein/sulfonate transport system permease protein
MMRTDAVMVGILAIGLIGWLLDALFYRALVLGLARRFPEVAR